MILTVERSVHDQIAALVRQLYALPEAPAFAVEVPPSRALGDLAVTVAFQLARPLRRVPRVIAQEIAAAAGGAGILSGVARIEVAPNGYLNLFLDRRAFALPRFRGAVPPPALDADASGKVVVEHTAINPNKAAHIGHLRNAALGDTLARVLRFRGTPVEVQNYIDDTGVQVADVVVGFRELEHKSRADVEALARETRFDYYCWDLYSTVTEWYEGDQARLAVRAAALHDLEHGGNETAALGAVIVDRIVRAHLATMARLNIGYDLLTYEGDILRLHFWAKAFEILKAQGAVFLQTEGRLAGCWVMRIDEGREAAESAAAGDAEDAADAREKVIVRSNGVVTYVGKDIANQFWKFGLLGRDFHYRRIASGGPGELWATTSDDGDPNPPAFGRATRIYNVIDSRQMYLQALLSQALRTLGHAREAEHSIHFSYEMVALSHSTARELGHEPPAGAPGNPGSPGNEDAKKPFVEVSGRKGLGVKIDDLLDLLTTKAAAEVAGRNPGMDEAERRRVATQIAVGAIRYFMLKYSRGKIIVFDIAEALAFEGETGPYLQYAVVRANNIFHKLAEREGTAPAEILAGLDAAGAAELDEADSALWALVFEAARLDEVVEQVVRTLEFSVLAKYAFGLAQLFNAFYHRSPILNEEDADRKRWRAAGIGYVRDQLTRGLDLMGIEVPSRM